MKRRKRILKRLVPDYQPPLSDINITPLVDVSFTILIIFILVAPILEQGINLVLPRSKASKIESEESLTVEIDQKGWIFLDGERVTIETLRNTLLTIAQVKENLTILIKADYRNSYGTVVDVLDTIKNAGIEKIGIVTREKAK
ncbi:MAG: biopolymer transporter ExbD [Candidatus Aureabacteria bacterium]|nr:biopolymer transporter ExbD [Candidatus Auribacterota bacterium]